MDKQELLVKLLAAVWVGLQTAALMLSIWLEGPFAVAGGQIAQLDPKKKRKYLSQNAICVVFMSHPFQQSVFLSWICFVTMVYGALNPAVLKIGVWFPQEVIFFSVFLLTPLNVSVKIYLLIPTQF